MKKKYTAPHMTVEQVKVNCSILQLSKANLNGSMSGKSLNDAGAKERDGDVWSTDKNDLDWDF